MTSNLARFVRPAGAVTALLLVAGTLQAVPAAAEPTEYIRVWARAVYPYDETPSSPGYTPDAPADARLAPGSVSLDVQVQSTAATLHNITVAPRVVTNGRVEGIRCATTPIFPDDVPVPDDAARASRQRESPQPDSRHRSSQLGAAQSWTDPTVVLAQYQSLYCAVDVSGITDKVLNEVVTSATAMDEDNRTLPPADTHVWAAAGALRPPPSDPLSIGQEAWLDRNGDGYQQTSTDPPNPDLNEPGIPGLHLTIVGPAGKPVPYYPTGQGVIGPLTTDQDGRYRFDHLRPFVNYYTVTLDLDSPALAGLVKSRHAPGTVSPDGSSWSQKVHALSGGIGDAVNWPFLPKNMLALTLDTRWTAVAGSIMTITGHAERADIGAWDGPVVLESRAGGATTWTKVADATSDQGMLAVKVTATRSADFRLRAPGDHDTAPAISPDFHVVVRTTPVALTAAAPASVRQGAPLTVTGTIRRASKPFQTGRIVLEYSSDASTWTRVADVRSTAGVMSATVQPSRTGSYRYRYLGDSTTAPGTSPARHVDVSSATAPKSPAPQPPR